MFAPRKRAWRRLHSRREDGEDCSRLPLSLFVDGGALTDITPIIYKSFSDHRLKEDSTVMRRTVSDRTSLFGCVSPTTAVVSKKVAFKSEVRVRLIPTAKELPLQERDLIWYSRDDIKDFQQFFLSTLPPGLVVNSKTSILSLGDKLQDVDQIVTAEAVIVGCA